MKITVNLSATALGSVCSPTCTDKDECDLGEAKCHPNAVCQNTKGFYNCTCKDGFRGNGFQCEGLHLYLNFLYH